MGSFCFFSLAAMLGGGVTDSFCVVFFPLPSRRRGGKPKSEEEGMGNISCFNRASLEGSHPTASAVNKNRYLT